MYVSVPGVLSGATVSYGSVALLIYAVTFWIAMHCRVVFFEEPLLIRTFTSEYADYCSRIGRWLPRL